MVYLQGVVIVVAALVLLALTAGRLGLLRGRTPSRLGLTDGRLKPPSKTPNSVSSQADLWPEHPRREEALVTPLPAPGDADAAWARLRAQVATMAGARIVDARADYLYAQFSTRWLKFTDDTEFLLDRAAGVIHVRSASRVGRKDFGVNRERIESLRAALATAG